MRKRNTYKFPSIFRIIADLFAGKILKIGFLRLDRKWKIATALIGSILMLILLTFSVFDLYSSYQDKLKLESERNKIIQEIEYWQDVVNKYKDYRDAYFQLAILEYRLKDFNKSKFYLDRALELDPNFEKGRVMETILK